jgi:hypothetical protein
MNKLIGTTYGLVQCDLHETRPVCIKCQRADVLKQPGITKYNDTKLERLPCWLLFERYN